MVQVTLAAAIPEEAAVQAIARLAGSTSTPVRSPVAGFLIRQVLTEGSIVKKGDELFVLNPHPFDKSSSATGYIKIFARADGATGRSSAAPGEAVAANEILTSIATLDPIAVEFSLPAASMQKYGDELQRQLALPESQRPEEFQLESDQGAVYRRKGRLGDGSLGSGGMRAIFPNPDRVLLPGQYVRVHWHPHSKSGGVVVPASSVRGQGNDAAVEVVTSDNTIERRPVTVSGSTENSRIVTGLKAGERVVLDNDGTLAPGEKVAVPSMGRP